MEFSHGHAKKQSFFAYYYESAYIMAKTAAAGMLIPFLVRTALLLPLLQFLWTNISMRVYETDLYCHQNMLQNCHWLVVVVAECWCRSKSGGAEKEENVLC